MVYAADTRILANANSKMGLRMLFLAQRGNEIKARMNHSFPHMRTLECKATKSTKQSSTEVNIIDYLFCLVLLNPQIPHLLHRHL